MIKLVLICLAFGLVHSAPAPTKKTVETLPPLDDTVIAEEVKQVAENLNTGLYYDQYLQKVVKLIESDETFKKKMENADFEEIKSGKLSTEINKMPIDIRNQLNDLKKEEMNRLRKILHAKVNLDNGRKVQKSAYLNQIANHLDQKNPHTFEAQDLTNLIKAATNDLENYDKARHEEFKKYEMEKELRREEKMQKLDEQEREKARKEYQDKQAELAKNSAMHHPGSRDQFDEVWKKDDGLLDEEFNPKTFFAIHDVNGDNFLDTTELEAIFEKDLAKVYDETDPNFDFMKMEEERRRMREHVMDEVDKDKDGVISKKEFIKYSETPQFADPDLDSYKNLDQLLAEHALYTQDEMVKYRESIKEQEDILKQKLEALKSHAKELGGLRRDFGEDRREAGKDGIQDHEKIRLDQKEQVIKEQESKMQLMHKDLQEQSKEILQMKQELQKHEASDKIAKNIKKKVDDLPPGEEKEKAIEQAHKELDNLKRVQGLKPDDAGNEQETAETPQVPPSDPNVEAVPQS